MADVHLGWGGDLGTTATGDLAVVGGGPAGTERVLRRLLTNPGDYIWQKDYGAGLARFVGMPADSAAVAALIRVQMRREPAVAAEPEPVIEVQAELPGTLSVQVRYADAETAETRTLNIQLPG